MSIKKVVVNVLQTSCPLAPASVDKVKKPRKVKRFARKARILEMSKELLALYDPKLADVVVTIVSGKPGKDPKIEIPRSLALRLNLLGGSKLRVVNCSDQVVSFRH